MAAPSSWKAWRSVSVAWARMGTEVPAKLEELLAGIGAAIDAVGGSFTMRYTTVAVTAARTGAASPVRPRDSERPGEGLIKGEDRGQAAVSWRWSTHALAACRAGSQNPRAFVQQRIHQMILTAGSRSAPGPSDEPQPTGVARCRWFPGHAYRRSVNGIQQRASHLPQLESPSRPPKACWYCVKCPP